MAQLDHVAAMTMTDVWVIIILAVVAGLVGWFGQ